MTPKDRKKKLSEQKELQREKEEALLAPLYKIWFKCFWSWPLGHRYGKGFYCVGCGKPMTPWSNPWSLYEIEESVRRAKQYGLLK
jgi:hypothetical protein